MAKFICRKVKYKQRFRWDIRGSNQDYYYSKLWVSELSFDLNLCIVKDRAGLFWLSPYGQYPAHDNRYDKGAYPDLPTAKAAAEIYFTLNAKPVWKKSRRKLHETSKEYLP